MAGVIDAVTQCVRAGGQSWPFEVDLRTGVATLGGWRVRALLWGEKRRLARFANAGPAFLKRHFVVVCVTGAALPAEDAAEFDALWTLSQWMTTPDLSEPGLPLQSTLLASVTLGLCGSLGWRPGDLDEMAASDVEAFWASARGDEADAEELTEGSSSEAVERSGGVRGSSALRMPLSVRGLPGVAHAQRPRRASAEQPAAGMSRIRIVPDPGADAEQASVTELGPKAAASTPETLETDASSRFAEAAADGSRTRAPRFRASVFDAQVRPRLDAVPEGLAVPEDVVPVTDEELLTSVRRTLDRREYVPTHPDPVIAGATESTGGPVWMSEPAFPTRVQFASSEKASEAPLFAAEDDRAALFEDWAQQLQDAAEELGIDTSD